MWKTEFFLHLVLICRLHWLKTAWCQFSVFIFVWFLFFFVFFNHSMLLWTCMVFQSCCILSLLSFLLCNLYFQMQNLKDYFGYVHACEMFRMLISTKSCWVWKKEIRLLLKIKYMTFYLIINAIFFKNLQHNFPYAKSAIHHKYLLPSVFF